MADFCMECSLRTFGEDCGDLAGIAPEHGYAVCLCEGCGEPIVVDPTGKKISTWADWEDGA